MRIEHLTSYLNLNSSPHAVHLKGKIKHNLGIESKEHTSVSQSANKSVSNIKPAKSVNFSGFVSSTSASSQKAVRAAMSELGMKEAPNWANKFVQSQGVNNTLKLVKENETLFENLITIVLAGLMKPICVLLMPGSPEKDKQVTATKNFVSAVAGFVMGVSILTPLSKGVKKVTAAPAKYIKDPEYLTRVTKENAKELVGKPYIGDAFETFYKRFPDLGISPAKAAITFAFMPYVLDFLFKAKNERKDAAKRAAMEKKAQTPDLSIKLSGDTNVFKKFEGGVVKS